MFKDQHLICIHKRSEYFDKGHAQNSGQRVLGRGKAILKTHTHTRALSYQIDWWEEEKLAYDLV